MTEDQAVASWKSCGIPTRYTNTEKSISYYASLEGSTLQNKATFLYNLFQTPRFRANVLTERLGTIWFDEDEELFALLARTVAVNLSTPILYTDLMLINQPRSTKLYESCLSGDIKALFIRRFYCPGMPNAFSESDKLRIELNLQWIADRGVALFLHFEADQGKDDRWWRPSFMKLLSKICPSYS